MIFYFFNLLCFAFYTKFGILKKNIIRGEYMIKVVVDCFGADKGEQIMVQGAVKAVNECSDIQVVLVGDQSKIEEALNTETYKKEQIVVIHAPEGISNMDTPTIAIRQKKESSLVKALDLVKSDDDVAGLVSCGSTGAVLTGAFMKLGRIKGISRPALCPTLPTKTGGKVCIMDCGANMDCKPQNLVHFALMGNAYMQSMGIEHPRVALLNVGVEDKKGNELAKETFPLLKSLDINFVGNMEARELLSGDYDLVVTDGFAGNVLLKSTEGAILNLLSMLKTDIKSRFFSKIGAIFMGKTFKYLKKTLDYNNYGGAVFLGCKKVVVKGHGSSKAASVCACIQQVIAMHKANLIEKVTQALPNLATEENTESC